MGNDAPPESRPSGAAAVKGEKPRAAGAPTFGDPKAIIRSVVGTGIGLGTLILMLAGLLFQQNAGHNVGVNIRIDDVSDRIDDVNTRIDDMNDRIDHLNANVNARINDMNARIDDLQEDIRELRALIISAIQGTDPAD